MNNIDIQYQELLHHIKTTGTRKETRNGSVISTFGRQIRHDMSEGFPLLTTKKMYWKGIVTELLWFLRGDTNIKFLLDNDCHIWDGDAYKNYLHKVIRDKDIVRYLKSYSIDTKGVPTIEPYSKDEFIDRIKTDDAFAKQWGYLGPIYGAQWRKWKSYKGGEYSNSIDQIRNLIDELKTNPDSRRLMVNAWNVGELDYMVLPPCHYGFQCYTKELNYNERVKILLNNKIDYDGDILRDKGHDYLDEKNIPKRSLSLLWNQRSVDTFLGLPFNIASYGLLLEILAKATNMVPDQLIGNLGDVHIYSEHMDAVNEQLKRTSLELPKLYINDEFWNHEYKTLDGWINGIEVVDFQLENYESYPAIKAPLIN